MKKCNKTKQGISKGLTKSQETAIKILEVVEKQEKVYEGINDQLRNLSPDFPNHIQVMDEKVRAEVYKGVNLLLGELDFVEYYLYEGDARCIYPKYKTNPKLKFKVTTIDEVRKYFLAKNKDFK